MANRANGGAPKKTNGRSGDVKILINFMDWNNGGELDAYHEVEMPEITEEGVRDAALELVNDGCGYFLHYYDIPCEAAQERYSVHAGDCDKGINDMMACSCAFDGAYDGEIDFGGEDPQCGFCDEESAREAAKNAPYAPAPTAAKSVGAETPRPLL